ncbi:hypothetical protein P8625_08670 [Tenacibaculum tangerinum]|uniref:Thioesterase domain-containing protein n=1 Tax=Tenacibaculum tangerinum TaxID=3038772 RepID=A0ABY8KYT7_9FLAO|nr:hypothetical protein [Tenacibaculum tangerinum]WGH74194.1 hypothetical protein P8625_08670 [Tenacibaculum tangerinum]
MFYGSDENISETEINDWKNNETTNDVAIHKLTGNHFFIFNNAYTFKEHINKIVFNYH